MSAKFILQETKEGEVEEEEQKHEGGVGEGNEEKWIGERYNNNNNNKYLGMIGAWLPDGEW
jgi:hypothetical protein